MPEIYFKAVLKTAEKATADAVLALNGAAVNSSTLATLATLVGSQTPAPPATGTTSMHALKIAKDLYRLELSGDACEQVLEILSGATTHLALQYWCFLSHEDGYDVYTLNDGAGYWSASVFIEGANDTEEDRREIEPQWWASMAKPVLAQFTDDVPSALAQVEKHKAKMAVEVDHERRFLTDHIERDGVILKLRIKSKKARTTLYRRLKAYITTPASDFTALAQFFTQRRMECMGTDDGTLYPDWAAQIKAPPGLAEGMMFVEESGNHLYVGFQLDKSLQPYTVGDCNVGYNGTYTLNLAHYFAILADSVSGTVLVRQPDNRYRTFGIYQHSGYLYLS